MSGGTATIKAAPSEDRLECFLIQFPHEVPAYDADGQVVREQTYRSEKGYGIVVYPREGVVRIWSKRARSAAQVTTVSLAGASWMRVDDVVQRDK